MPLFSKRDAAKRQLNAAIRLFFAAGDPVAVHCLASSAANLYSDLVEKTTVKDSWRKRFAGTGDYRGNEVKQVLNHAWNFFKHGDRDADEELDFEETQTELMLFYAILECGELEPPSDEMQVFQLWLLRTGRLEVELTGEIEAVATILFPDLCSLDRRGQIAKGYERLRAIPLLPPNAK